MYVCRKINLPIVLVPGLKQNLSSVVAATKKVVKIIICTGKRTRSLI